MGIERKMTLNLGQRLGNLEGNFCQTDVTWGAILFDLPRHLAMNETFCYLFGISPH